MNDKDVIELFEQIPKDSTTVEIYQNKKQDQEYNNAEFINNKILEACKKLMQKEMKYTEKATSIIPLSYPMGDFDKSIGTCSDVVIRALRYINIDLQALLYEDIILNPERYSQIQSPDYNIDHRRVKNLKIYFDNYAETLSIESPLNKPKEWLSGDIVIFDTGVSNGTIYDHIGIVSMSKAKKIPLVINLWTIGYKLQEMELLKGDYPKIVAHYRIKHPFDYNTIPILIDMH